MAAKVEISKGWLIGIATVAVVALIAVGALAWVSLSGDRSTASGDEASSAAAEPSPSASENSARMAQGCLGGQALSDETVLTAQKEAQTDAIGAAEFAASLYRWMGATDETLAAQSSLEPVFESVIASEASDEVAGWPDMAAEADLPAERQGPEGKTENGGYYIESSSEDQVVVSVALRVPEKDADDGKWVSTRTFTLVAEDGAWKLKDLGNAREPEDMLNVMSLYEGGC